MPDPQYPQNSTPVPSQPNLDLVKKDYRKIISLIAVSVVLITSAVFGTILLTSKKDTVNEPKKITLTFWGMSDDELDVKAVIDKYQSEHSNVTINYEKRSLTNYKENLKSRLENGVAESLPDIVEIDSKWATQFANNLSSANTNLITLDDFNNRFFPSAQRDLQQYKNNNTQASIVGLPLKFNGLVLFYNKKIIPNAESIPAFWPDFKTYAQSLTTFVPVGPNTTEKKLTRAGVAMGAYPNVDYDSDILQMLMMQNRIIFPDFVNDTNAFQSKSNIAFAINFYKSFTPQSSSDTPIWNKDFKDSLTEFANGNAAMVFGFSDDVDNLKAINPNLEFGVTVPPIVAGQIFYSSKSTALVAPDIKGNKDEAWNFMNYYTQDENLKTVFEKEKKNKKIYPSKTMMKTLEKDPLYGAFAKIAPTAYSWRAPDWEKVSSFFTTVADDNFTYFDETVTTMIEKFYGLYQP